MTLGSRRRAGLVLPFLLLSLVLSVCPAFADIVYLYDGLGRLVRVIDQTGQAATYVYDPVGNILQIARQTGVPQDQTALTSADPPNASQGSQVTLTFTGTNLVGATLPTLPAGMSLVSTGFSVSGNQDVLTLTLAIDPEFALGPQSMTLVSALGQTALPFSLNVARPPPRVDRMIPPIVTIGSLVQVEGAAFDPSSLTASQVTVNGVSLPVISARSDALIAQVPLGVTTGPVRVTTAQGTGVNSTSLTVVPATHPQQNVVTATLQAPFRTPDRIAFSPDGTRAYVIGTGVGVGPGSVAVVNTVESTVLATPAITFPTAVAVTPDGSRVLVTRNNPSTLVVIDALTLGVTTTIPLPAVTRDVAVSPDGRFAYIGIATPAVSVVDLGTLTEVARISLSGDPTFVAVSPDGNTLYAIGNPVSVVDVATRQVLRTIPHSITVQTFALDPVAQRLYLVGPFGCCSTFQALDLQAGTILRTLGGLGLALSPDRTRLYVFDAFADGTGVPGLRVLDPTTLATLGTLLLATAPPPAPQALLVSPDGATLWMAGASDNTLRVVDTGALALVGTIPVGVAPTAVGLVPGRAELYVLNRLSNTVSVIETPTNALRPTALDAFGLRQPLGTVVPADASAVYVANSGAPTTVAFTPATGGGLAIPLVGETLQSEGHLAVALSRNELYVGNAAPLGVWILDLRTRAQKEFLPLTRAIRAMVLSLDERRLYVATDVGPVGCVGGGCQGVRLTTFDAETGAQLGQLTLDPAPPTDAMVLNPEGTRLYVLSTVASGQPGQVQVIDTATLSLLATIPVGTSPGRLAFGRSGQRLYVVNLNSVSVLDPQTNQVVATIPTNQACCPQNIVFSLDGSKAYVAQRSLVVIDTATNTVRTTIGVFFLRALALSPDGQRLFATRDAATGQVSVIDTATEQVVATIPVGSSASAVALSSGRVPINVTVSPDGTRVWVVNTSDDSISVIE